MPGVNVQLALVFKTKFYCVAYVCRDNLLISSRKLKYISLNYLEGESRSRNTMHGKKVPLYIL